MPSVEMLYKYKLPNTPDKSIVGLKVGFSPGAGSPPHTHLGASVAVHVLTGAVFNKMNDDPVTIKRAGESFFEAPGCRHRISAEATGTEEASLLATMVIETDKLEAALESQGVMGLVVIDEEWFEVVMQALAEKQGGA